MKHQFRWTLGLLLFFAGMLNYVDRMAMSVAAPFIGLLALSWGWRIAFAGTAFLGCVWLAAWRLLFRDTPARHPRVSAEERAHIEARRASGPAPVVSAGRSGWRDVFSARVLGVALAFFSFNYFLLSWLPSYLVDYQHLDIGHMAIAGAIPWLDAAVGLVSGGVLADLLARVMRDALLARKAIIFLGLSGPARCILLASRAVARWACSFWSAPPMQRA